MLAPSAFLASAASTFQLQQSILPVSILSLEDGSLESIEALWASHPIQPNRRQKFSTYRRPGMDRLLQTIVHSFWQEPLVNTARLLAAFSPHSGDWLHAPPITTVGLRLSDVIRVAVAHRLGCKACEPLTCVCGKPVDARGLHGLSCRKNAPRQQRHSHINDIIWRAIKRAQVPAVKEPVSLTLEKRPDGTTLLPWGKGKPLAWDVSLRHLCRVTHR